MKHQRRVILGTMIVLGAVVAGAVALSPSAGRRVDCRPSLQSPTGAYANLAVVDEEGLVFPFSRVNLDDEAVWELEIKDEHGEVRRVRDRSRISRLQRQRFECIGTDMATPDMGVGIYRNGALVYRTDFVKGEGIQNPEFGFARAKSRLMFVWLLR